MKAVLGRLELYLESKVTYDYVTLWKCSTQQQQNIWLIINKLID